jgi:hypothetical protein
VEGKYGVLHPYTYSLAEFYDKSPRAFDKWLRGREERADSALKFLPTLEADPDLKQKYIAKLYRDTSILRLSRAYADPSSLDSQVDLGKLSSPGSRARLDTEIDIAEKLDPANPDLKAIKEERERLRSR